MSSFQNNNFNKNPHSISFFEISFSQLYDLFFGVGENKTEQSRDLGHRENENTCLIPNLECCVNKNVLFSKAVESTEGFIGQKSNIRNVIFKQNHCWWCGQWIGKDRVSGAGNQY